MTSPDFLHLGGAFALINRWTFLLFGFDKLRAQAGVWRISEGTLILFAFIGGTIGAYAGRKLFRHKTRKQPFSNQLHSVAVIQALILAAVIGYSLG